MTRHYDPKLVQVLQASARTERDGNLTVRHKPVPDAEGEHILDPRVLAYALRKMDTKDARAEGVPEGEGLYAARHRGERPSFDLTSGTVRFSQRLVGDGDHDIHVYAWQPENQDPGAPALLYLHGGGFNRHHVPAFQNACALIAEQSGATVVFPDYRLAPETKHPGQLEDCLLAYRWLVDNANALGIDPSRIAVGGDSAGGNLSCACIHALPAGSFAHAFLLYPLVDMALGLEGWSYDLYPVSDPYQEPYVRNRIDSIKNDMENAGATNLYLREGTDRTDPLLSPMRSEELASFPPTTVVVSEYDFLRVQDEMFARKLAETGIETTLTYYHGNDHGFFELLGVRPQAEDLALDMATQLRALPA